MAYTIHAPKLAQRHHRAPRMASTQMAHLFTVKQKIKEAKQRRERYKAAGVRLVAANLGMAVGGANHVCVACGPPPHPQMAETNLVHRDMHDMQG